MDEAVIERMEPGIVPGPITAGQLRSCRSCLFDGLFVLPRLLRRDVATHPTSTGDAVLVIEVKVTSPQCSIQRATGLGGVTGDRELNGFNSVPALFVGGVPWTRAMNPWAMPEASA
jgi:hypothetical protein